MVAQSDAEASQSQIASLQTERQATDKKESDKQGQKERKTEKEERSAPTLQSHGWTPVSRDSSPLKDDFELLLRRYREEKERKAKHKQEQHERERREKERRNEDRKEEREREREKMWEKKRGGRKRSLAGSPNLSVGGRARGRGKMPITKPSSSNYADSMPPNNHMSMPMMSMPVPMPIQSGFNQFHNSHAMHLHMPPFYGGHPSYSLPPQPLPNIDVQVHSIHNLGC